MQRRLLVALPLAAIVRVGRAGDAVASHDVVALKRLINLPADVTSAQWQTGPMAAHGGDWWLAAVLDVPADRLSRFLTGPGVPGTIDTPPGMRVDALKAVPGAHPIDGDRLGIPGQLHGIEPFASSPLLNGHALRLSPTRVFVLLWTN